MGLIRRDTATIERLEQVEAELGRTLDNVDLYEERIAELELALEDTGWDLVSGGGNDREFSREALRKIAKHSRLAGIKNPLIGRAVRVRTYYTFGQGVQISADHEQLNDVLQRTMANRLNRKAFFGHQARKELDHDLQHDGNVFIACFTHPTTGRVKVRTIPFAEIVDVVSNPDDRADVWFYKRQWTQETTDLATGAVSTRTQTRLYPAMWYQPEVLQKRRMGDDNIVWDAPILHVKTGGRGDMRFGIPETYAALDWAKAYKEFLEDWATLVRSLSKLAWKLTTKGRKVAAAKTRLGTGITTTSGTESNPPPVAGSTFIQPEGTNLEAIPKTGATIAASDGKQLRLMVASAMDLPDTILSGDADQGNRATAETMDRPTELAIADRQQMWTDVAREVCTYIAAQAITAPNGALQSVGSVTVDDSDIEILIDGDPVKIVVEFPPVLEPDTDAMVKALITAATLDGKTPAGTIPPDALARRLMTVLGFDDVDDLVAELEAIADRAGLTDDADVTEALRQVRDVLVILGEAA